MTSCTLLSTLNVKCCTGWCVPLGGWCLRGKSVLLQMRGSLFISATIVLLLMESPAPAQASKKKRIKTQVRFNKIGETALDVSAVECFRACAAIGRMSPCISRSSVHIS